MVRFFVSVPFVIAVFGMAGPMVVQPAVAQGGCTAWTAQMEPDEGGDVMVAAACPLPDSMMPPLRLMCFDTVSIRYYPPDDEPLGLIPEDTAGFVFEAGAQQIPIEMVYEDLDGALAIYVERDDPLVALLRSADTVVVGSVDYDLVPRTIPLTGADEAIGKLFETCS